MRERRAGRMHAQNQSTGTRWVACKVPDEFDAQLAARDVTCLLALGRHAIDTGPSNERQSRAGDRRGTWSSSIAGASWTLLQSPVEQCAGCERTTGPRPNGDTISVLRGLSLSSCDAPPDDPALGTTVVHMSRPGGPRMPSCAAPRLGSESRLRVAGVRTGIPVRIGSPFVGVGLVGWGSRCPRR
jgi:hypothetical protein